MTQLETIKAITTPPDKELLKVLSAFLTAAKGTPCQYAAGKMVESLCYPRFIVTFKEPDA